VKVCAIAELRIAADAFGVVERRYDYSAMKHETRLALYDWRNRPSFS
jgi:hypothetical protein